ncbi:hypothetical protein [Helicobacter zhangjianzhongii]|nr:hypothetical protein [Helicobacter sp. CPD2-1]MDL0080276.1 hypothetical protein [Helicobacter sp. CPD2-1]
MDSRIVELESGLCRLSGATCSRWDFRAKNGALQGDSRDLP